MRLIDADMTDVIIIYDKGNELTQVSAIREYIERQREFLDKFPTVDAVPVVRCKDCEYFRLNDENVPYCLNPFGLDDPEPNGFCNYGIGKN